MTNLNHGNAHYLTHDHRLVSRVKDIGSENDLAHHLVLWHNSSVQGQSKRQMAMTHLLAHTVMNSPALKEKLELPQEWGSP